MSKVLIIGGGAAGMLAAISAAQNYNQVHIYEQNEKLGKKIFITGKGRCNITNSSEMDVVMKNVVSNGKFLYSAFNSFTNQDIVDILEEQGIETKVERGNRVFPVSDKSSDVIKGLRQRLEELGVEIHLNSQVEDLLIEGKAVKGIIVKNKGKIYGDYVIVATGGKSYETTGSTGDGYRFAKTCGHNIIEPKPALVPLETREAYVKDLMGLSLKNIQASLYSEGKLIYSEFGEMLFTHFGVSGPVVLSGSSCITGLLSQGKCVELKIDLKPALDEEALDNRLLRDFADNINKDFRNSLNNLLPKSLIPVIINESGISPFKKINEITREERKNLIRAIKELTLHITKTRGFNEAIITQGGVDVSQIKPKNMESKLISGLYFVGEVLDVDGFTGGYNLQIAWSSGYQAGKDMY